MSLSSQMSNFNLISDGSNLFLPTEKGCFVLSEFYLTSYAFSMEYLNNTNVNVQLRCPHETIKYISKDEFNIEQEININKMSVEEILLYLNKRILERDEKR